MTAAAILEEIKMLGQESYRRVLLNHGVGEPCFGVKISELKLVMKRTGKDYQLALDLFETGVYDARYLAGLIADDARMTKKNLQRWADTACIPLAGSSVAWVTAGSPHGWELGRKWIESAQEPVAVAGWGALAGLVSIREDRELDLGELHRLLGHIKTTIHQMPNNVRYVMNSFVIAAGSYVPALTAMAIEAGEQIGVVEVDMGPTSCAVPFSPAYIRKVEARGTLGKKRKTAKC